MFTGSDVLIKQMRKYEKDDLCAGWTEEEFATVHGSVILKPNNSAMLLFFRLSNIFGMNIWF